MRLIDADDIEYFPLDEVFNHSVMIAFKERIDVIPTVELIRCKDCKYSSDDYGDGDCYCDLSVKYIGKDWNHFCSWAERK